jgi:hypothetical protein
MPYTLGIRASFALSVLLNFSTTASHATPGFFKFLPGYYVAKTGDTVFCDIDFKDWSKNPATFTARVKGEEKTYAPADITAFGVIGYADFKSATVTYHPDPISGTDFPNQFSEKTETNSYFLKTVVNGPYCLYELNIPGRYIYFVSRQTGPITELVYRVKLVDQAIQEDQQYKRTLSDYFSQEGVEQKFLGSINSASYHLSDLRKLVNRLNEHRTGKAPAKQKSGGIAQFEIFGGGALHSFPTPIFTKFAPNYRFANQVNPTGGLNYLYRFPNRFHSFALGVSIGYTQYSLTTSGSGTNYAYHSQNWNDTTKYSEILSMKRAQLEANLYAVYFFNPSGKIRPYLKLGVFESFSVSTNNDIYDSYKSSTTGIVNGVVPTKWSDQQTISLLSTKTYYVDLSVAAGIAAGRHKLELMAMIPQGNIAEVVADTYKVGSYSLCYFLTLLK